MQIVELRTELFMKWFFFSLFIWNRSKVTDCDWGKKQILWQFFFSFDSFLFFFNFLLFSAIACECAFLCVRIVVCVGAFVCVCAIVNRKEHKVRMRTQRWWAKKMFLFLLNTICYICKRIWKCSEEIFVVYVFLFRDGTTTTTPTIINYLIYSIKTH